MKKEVVIDISGREEEGILYNTIEKKAFRLGKNEYEIWKLLNSNENIETIYKECNYFEKDNIDALIQLMYKKNLLNMSHNSKRKKQWREIKLGLIYPENFLKNNFKIIKNISRVTNWLFLPSFILVMVLIIFTYQKVKNTIVHSNYIYIGVISLILMILSLSIHEIFHAIEAKRWGGKVLEFGVKLYCGFPVAYTSMCDLKGISEKGQMLIMLAGMKINIIIIIMCLCLCLLTFTSTFSKIWISVFLSNLFPVLGNLNIYYKFDLHYIAEILIEEIGLIDNLNSKHNKIYSDKYPIYKLLVKINEILLVIMVLILIFVKVKG